jgi:hypothetical protein
MVGALRHQWAPDPDPARSISFSGGWLGPELFPSPRLAVKLTMGAALRHIRIDSLSENTGLVGLSVDVTLIVLRRGRFELAPAARYRVLHAFNSESFFRQQIGLLVLGAVRF